MPFGRDVRLGAAHPALSLTWHADVAKLVVGNGRWYHLVDARDGACADVVPMNSMGSDRRTESLETSRRFPTTLAIVEVDGSRAVVCVTGTRAAVVSPLGEPAGKALRLGGDSPGGAYSLAFAAPYLVAAPVPPDPEEEVLEEDDKDDEEDELDGGDRARRASVAVVVQPAALDVWSEPFAP